MTKSVLIERIAESLKLPAGKAEAIVKADPGVAVVSSHLGGGVWAQAINSGWLNISLKPPGERDGTTQQVVEFE